MRIAFCSRHAWPSVGGIETAVRTVANTLAGDHQVAVFAHRIEGGADWRGPFDREPPFPAFQDPGSGVLTTQLRLGLIDRAALVPFSAVDPRSERGRRTTLEMWHARVCGRRFARQFGAVDIVHRVGGNRFAIAAATAARRLQAPAIITPFAHGGHWDDDWLSAIGYRSADVVIATCRADARTYERLGVEGSRIEICGLPSREVAPRTDRPPAALHEHRGPVVLFVGVRRPYKGIDVLLQAARLLGPTQPDARFAFVGPGAALPPDAPPNTIDVGEVDMPERDAWMRAADVVCLPSTNESWGLAISEAWSAGVPVVTSDIPVLRERVEEAGGGIATRAQPRALALALEALLQDPGRRRRMGDAGRQRWRTWLSPGAVAARHVEIYDRARARPLRTGPLGW